MNRVTERPNARDDISEEMIDQDLFLFDEGTGSVHQLNSGAAMVWFLCDGTRDVASIAGEIAQSADAGATEVMLDVRETLKKFDELGLMVSE